VPERDEVRTDAVTSYFKTNSDSNTISVIDGLHNKVVANITVRESPSAVAVNPNTNIVYVANSVSDTVSVIDGSINQVVAGVTFGSLLFSNSSFELSSLFLTNFRTNCNPFSISSFFIGCRTISIQSNPIQSS
jgi:YVTN family beta-propeller protein